MIIGPAIATPIINRWGRRQLVNGAEGVVPTPVLFLFSAAITLLSAIPLARAAALHRQAATKDAAQ